MKSYLQFIGAGALDSGPMSLLLFFDERRYLINCSEGTQRAAILDAIRISKVEACFVSSLEWSRLGGLAGLMCTLRDQHEAGGGGEGGEPFTVIGPKGLGRLLEATHPFVRRVKYPISAIELDHQNQTFSDDFLTVHHLHLHSERVPAAKKIRSPSTTHHYTTMAYMFCPPAVPGKFDVERAKSLGLSPGPNYSLLVKGESVRNKEGLLINPRDCVGPPSKQPYIVVADVPTVAHLHSFTELIHEQAQWRDAVEDVKELVLFCGEKAVLERIKDVETIYTNARVHTIWRNNLLVNGEQAEFLRDLNTINPCYRVPVYDHESLSTVKPFTKIHLFPENHISSEPLRCEVPSAEPLPLHIDKLRCSFLGTAAAIPGKYRNVSGILLHLPVDSFIIMDCGEASLGQIARLYGQGNLQSVVDKVIALCLTHIHADHHLGAFSVILQRSKSLPPLLVYAPEAFRTWFAEYQEASGVELNVNFVSCTEQPEYQVGATKLIAFPVIHCPDAQGFRVEHENVSVVYSGDCRPSDSLVKAAENATIMIHEATMPDDLHEEAVARKHCTISEAINVYEQSTGCKYCVLTHLTQRFAKSFPQITAAGVSVASDLMSFTVDDLPGLISVTNQLPHA